MVALRGYVFNKFLKVFCGQTVGDKYFILLLKWF